MLYSLNCIKAIGTQGQNLGSRRPCELGIKHETGDARNQESSPRQFIRLSGVYDRKGHRLLLEI